MAYKEKFKVGDVVTALRFNAAHEKITGAVVRIHDDASDCMDVKNDATGIPETVLAKTCAVVERTAEPPADTRTEEKKIADAASYAEMQKANLQRLALETPAAQPSAVSEAQPVAPVAPPAAPEVAPPAPAEPVAEAPAPETPAPAEAPKAE